MTQIRPSPTKEAIRLTNFWQKFGPNTYPLNIQRLIEGAIQNSSFDSQLTTVVDSFDSFEGALIRKNHTKEWTILLNGTVENQRRMRFTYAHELGHFMCHRHLRDKFEDSESTLNDFRDDLEIEANSFASTLLMPANVLRSEFDTASWQIDTLRNLGNRFECSLQSSALRFVSLSIRPIAFVVSRDGLICWARKSDSAPYMSAYSFGNELPEDSIARIGKLDSQTCSIPQDSGFSWCETQRSIESNYLDSTGRGYQYTCIEFNN